jgi:hypothetical protein
MTSVSVPVFKIRKLFCRDNLTLWTSDAAGENDDGDNDN